jgi:hypothetical protein
MVVGVVQLLDVKRVRSGDRGARRSIPDYKGEVAEDLRYRRLPMKGHNAAYELQVANVFTCGPSPLPELVTIVESGRSNGYMLLEVGDKRLAPRIIPPSQYKSICGLLII